LEEEIPGPEIETNKESNNSQIIEEDGDGFEWF